jgi:hypothetical protein
MSSQADALNLAAVTCCQVPGGARPNMLVPCDGDDMARKRVWNA